MNKTKLNIYKLKNCTMKTISLSVKNAVLFFVAFLLMYISSCKKEDNIKVSPPSDLNYSTANITLEAGNSDSSVAPTINWNNNNGTFSFSSPPPTGIYINKNTGKISWSSVLPAGTYTLKVKATNSAGSSDEINFVLIITAKPPSDLKYRDTLKVILGSTTTYKSLSPSVLWNGSVGTFVNSSSTFLPSNGTVSQGPFAAISVVLDSGFVSVTQTASNTLNKGTYQIGIKAKNVAGFSDEFLYNILVGTTPTGLSYTGNASGNPLTTSAGTTASSASPTITDNGGLPITYSITSATSGITINPTTGVINIANNTATGTYTLTVKAINALSTSTTNTYAIASYYVKVNAVAPSGLSYTPSTISVGYGSVGSSATPVLTSNGGATITYSITSPTLLPTGVSIVTSTGVISWTAATPAGVYNLVITATNSIGNTTANYTLNINPRAPSNLTYTAQSGTIYSGTAGSTAVPSITNPDNATITYSITSPTTVPTGLSVGADGKISWTTATPAGVYNLVIQAMGNAGGSTTATYTLTLTAANSGSVSMTYPNSNSTITTKGSASGSAITPTVGNANGTVTYAATYSTGGATATPTAPTGITFTTSTGAISWSSTVPIGVYTINITATDVTSRTANVAYTLTVNPNAPSNLTYTAQSGTIYSGTAGSTAAPSITNPDNATITYSITSPTTLPTGLSVGADGKISWTTATPAGNYNIIVKATNTGGNTTANFTLNLTALNSTLNFSYDPIRSFGNYGTVGSTLVPTATGANGTVTYVATTGAVYPVGVSINSSGIISWTNAVAVGTYTLSVTGTDQTPGTPHTATISYTLQIKANVPVGFSYPNSNASTTPFNTAGEVNPNALTSNGGDAAVTITYSITEIKLGASSYTGSGISVASNTGKISWTSALAAGTYTINIKAANTDNFASATYTLTVQPALAFSGFSYESTTNTKSINFGAVASFSAPSFTNTGSGNITYLVTSPNLQAGITFDAATGKISWANNIAVGVYPISVKATDNVSGVELNVTYTLTVNANAPSGFAYDPSSTIGVFGTASSIVAPPNINWGGKTGTFSIAAQSGSVLPTTGTISVDVNGKINWTADVPIATYPLTVTANNGVSPSVTANFSLEIKSAVAAPTNLSYSAATPVVDYGIASSSVSPTVTGESITYTFAPKSGSSTTSIPAGMTISSSTGVISWTNTTLAGVYNVTVTATNAGGSITTDYTLTINKVAPTFTYSPNSNTTAKGVSGSSDLPNVSSTGGAALSYSLTSSITGISIDNSTGRITWDGSVAVGSNSISVIASNGGSTTTTAIYTLKIYDVPTGLAYSPALQEVNFGTAGTSATPTVTSDAASTVTYVATLNGSNTLPTGISISSSTGVISWNTSVAVGSYALSITPSNAAGAGAAVTYTLTVKPTVAAFSYSPASSTVAKGSANSSVGPTVTSTGGSPVTYSISAPTTGLTGISIAPTTGVISWNATAQVGTYDLTISGNNGAATAGTASYTLNIYDVPTGLTYSPTSSSVNFGTLGTSAIPTVTSDAASTVTYAATFNGSNTLPTGISISSSTGVISWNTSVAVGSYALSITPSNAAGVGVAVTYTLTVNPTVTFDARTNGGIEASITQNVPYNTAATAPTNPTKNGGYTFAGWFEATTGGAAITTFPAATSNTTYYAQYTANQVAIVDVPRDTTIGQGITASFSVVASANSGTLTYQWQKAESTANTSFSDISGATAASFTTAVATIADDNGDKYKVIITASNGTTITSTPVTLTVTPLAPTNLSYSTNSSSGVGKGSSVTPTVNGGGTMTYAIANNPSGVSINTSTGVISWTTSTKAGAYTLNISASNGVGSSATATYNLSIPLMLSFMKNDADGSYIFNGSKVNGSRSYTIKASGLSSVASENSITVAGISFPATNYTAAADETDTPSITFPFSPNVPYQSASTQMTVTVNGVTVNARSILVDMGFNTNALSKTYIPGTSTSFSNEPITVSGYGLTSTAADWKIVIFKGNAIPVTLTPTSAAANQLTFNAPNQYGEGTVEITHTPTSTVKTLTQRIHIPAFDSMILVDIYNAMGLSSLSADNTYGWNGSFPLSASILTTNQAAATTPRISGWGGIYLQAFGTTSITTTNNSGTATSTSHPESNGTYRVAKIYSVMSSYQTSGKVNNVGWKGILPASIGGTAPVAGIDNGAIDANGVAKWANPDGTTPNYKGGLTRLSALYANGQVIYGTIPNTFANLAYLGTLNLSGNLLTGSLPDGLGTNNNTSKITIGGGTSIAPTALYTLSGTTSLSLHNNNLTGALPNSITNASNFNGWVGVGVGVTSLTWSSTGGICYQNKKLNNTTTPPTGISYSTTGNGSSSSAAASDAPGFSTTGVTLSGTAQSSFNNACPVRWW